MTRRSTSSRPDTVRSVFFGLGVRRHGRREQEHDQDPRLEEGLHAQGYFVYDSKKSGSQTVSHLRFGPQPISAPYLIAQASFVGCHQFGLIERAEVLERAAPGATLLLNTHHPADQVWDALSRPVQEQMLAKAIELYVIDAGRIARDAGSRRTHQHGAADVLLRDLRRARARAGDRPDQGVDREDLRPARSRGRRAQPDRGRSLARGPSPRRAAGAGDLRRASSRRSCPTARRSSCARSPRR